MIIGIVGTLTSGTSTVARAIGERGYTVLHVNDFLREIAARRHLPDSSESLASIATELREKYGPAALVHEVLNRIRVPGKFVIDGVKNLAEIHLLRTRGKVLIIGVDADADLRFQRAVEYQSQMGVDEGGASRAEFRRRDALENGTSANGPQARSALALADVHIRNDGNIDELAAHARAAADAFERGEFPR